MAKLDATQALMMLAQTTMRAFTKCDWQGFQGCESPNPMIGEFSDEILGNYTLVVDGESLLVLHEEDMYGGIEFRLSLAFDFKNQ